MARRKLSRGKNETAREKEVFCGGTEGMVKSAESWRCGNNLIGS